MEAEMLFDLFIKTSEQKVLSLFAMNPDQVFYGRQVSRRLKISLGAAHGALLFLEKSGVLVSQIIGKTKLYRLESSNSIIYTFKIMNALLILDPLTQSLKRNSRRIILYGSYSTGTFASESDIDLFIVAEEKEKITGDIERFKRKTNLDIRPIIMSQIEWIKLEKEDPEYFSEISLGLTLWEKPVDERGF
jgi:predicted nucleotidyltransferase